MPYCMASNASTLSQNSSHSVLVLMTVSHLILIWYKKEFNSLKKYLSTRFLLRIIFCWKVGPIWSIDSTEGSFANNECDECWVHFALVFGLRSSVANINHKPLSHRIIHLGSASLFSYTNRSNRYICTNVGYCQTIANKTIRHRHRAKTKDKSVSSVPYIPYFAFHSLLFT